MSISRDISNLIDAASSVNDRFSEIKNLIEVKKVDINATDGQGTALFYTAAKKDKLEVVKYLITQKADVNKGNEWNVTPLSIAADYGCIETVAYLLEQKASVNAVSKDRKSALTITAETCNQTDKHIECIKMLLDYKADIDHQDKNGNTALMLANDPKVFDVLFASEASIELKNNEGRNLFLELCHSYEEDSARRLEKLFEKHPNVNVNVFDNQGKSAIDLILESHIEDKIALSKFKLLTKKIDSTLITRTFNSFLSSSAQTKKLKKLFDTGFKPKINTLLDELIYAYITNTFNDKFHVFLEDKEIEFSVYEKKILTNLYIKACEEKNFKIASKLVKFIDPNAKNNKGISLLEYAFDNDQIELVDTLIDAGADKEQIDEKGQSLLMRLMQNKFDTNPASILKLIERGASLSLVSKNGSTPLHFAVRNPSVPAEIVKAILDRYSKNINFKDELHCTALYIAALHLADFDSASPREQQVVQYLLDAKADRTIKCGGVSFDELANERRNLKSFVVSREPISNGATMSSVASIIRIFKITPEAIIEIPKIPTPHIKVVSTEKISCKKSPDMSFSKDLDEKTSKTGFRL